MLKKALVRFGLSSIKIHEIKTLVKFFLKDVNAGTDDGLDSDPEEDEPSGNEKSNMTLDLDAEKPKVVD